VGLDSLLFFAINGSRKYAIFRHRENVEERVYSTANILPEQKNHLREIEKYIFISSPPIVLVIHDGYRGMGHAWK
jgi:hypothetical protein